MSKYILYILFCFISGCTGDTLIFRHQGDARIDVNSICVNSSPGDILEFYLLSSSFDNYRKPIVMEEHISRKYPDTCIISEIKNPADYDLMYVLNDKKYRLNFTVDQDGKIYKR